MSEFTAASFFVMGTVWGVVMMIWLNDSMTPDQLVKANHAEYYLDENHQRQFRLKECK